jgi:hypothetical protein
VTSHNGQEAAGQPVPALTELVRSLAVSSTRDEVMRRLTDYTVTMYPPPTSPA